MILWSAVKGTTSSLVSGVWPCAQSCCWSQAGSSGWWHGRGGGPVGRFCPWCSPPDWPIVPLYHTQGTKCLAYGLVEAKRGDIDSSENVWGRLNSMVAQIHTFLHEVNMKMELLRFIKSLHLAFGEDLPAHFLSSLLLLHSPPHWNKKINEWMNEWINIRCKTVPQKYRDWWLLCFIDITLEFYVYQIWDCISQRHHGCLCFSLLSYLLKFQLPFHLKLNLNWELFL